MPPTFRSSRSGRQLGDGVNRTRTGQIDHDVFEGLPVRRWTRQVQTVSQEPKIDGTEPEAPGLGGKQSIPEHPMPRDSHLLAPVSRALLRAARSGCIYIRQASKEFEDEEKEPTDPEEQQLLQNMERNFSMRKWTAVPKHLEAPEVEFLAKRRPGLPSLYGATAGVVEGANGSVPMRKTRFKKVDPATGNISIYAAWVPEGHKIEGEVTDDAQLITDNSQVTVTPEAPAPGTVIEGVGVVNAEGVVVAEAGSSAVITPPRRRPPPPKRKAKGLKGRRKKVMFAPGEGADASLVHGAGAGDTATSYGKDTDSSRMSVDQTTQEDEDDEGEEGEESDDGEGEESGFDPKTPETPGPQPSAESEAEPTPGPAAGPTDISIISQAPLPSASEVTSPATADLMRSMSVDQHTGAAHAAPTPQEDVQMTDSRATNDTMRDSSSQLQTAPEGAHPISVGKTPSPRYRQTDPAQEISDIAPEHTIGGTDEKIAERIDIAMAEPSESVSSLAQAESVNPEISTAISQPPEARASEPEAISQESDKQPRGNEFDLLDNLEASLDNIPKETPGGKQKDPKSDHGQETAPESDSTIPAQPTVTPADAELAEATTEAKGKAPGETASQPSQMPAQPPEPPTHFQPSTELTTQATQQATTEKPQTSPQQPADTPSLPEITTEPSKAHDSPLLASPPSTSEGQQETNAVSEAAPDDANEQSESKSPAETDPTMDGHVSQHAPLNPNGGRGSSANTNGSQSSPLNNGDRDPSINSNGNQRPPMGPDPPLTWGWLEPSVEREYEAMLAQRQREKEQQASSSGSPTNGSPSNGNTQPQ
ncbi:uncharacterized protein BJX67DRAFT_153165 [Aspergillus lucknowensis]|uniref:Uncharacterized protein n=1 Tax=Aspergillus lucknowensis TaxID=176173 RepID=A0ABR4LND4_9EURO